MKAQMKAIMASAVVIALCLAAVGGVTYSWFSDTEQSQINISTATVEIDIDEITVGSVVGYGKAVPSGSSVAITDLAAMCIIPLNIKIDNSSTIETVYIVEAEIENFDNIDDETKAHLKINNILLSSAVDGKITMVGVKANANTDYSIPLELKTDETYNNQSEDYLEDGKTHSFRINFKITAYQGDYPTANIISPSNSGYTTIPDNGVVSAELIVNEKTVKVNTSFSDEATTAGETLTVSATTGTGTSGFSVSGTPYIIELQKDSQIASGHADITVSIPVDDEPTDVSVVYIGTESGSNPDVISSSYIANDGSTGGTLTVTFRTTHFSPFLIATGGIGVESEESLIKAMSPDNTINLTNTVNLSNDLFLKGTINFNGNSISAGNYKLVIDNVDTTLNNGSITITGDGTYSNNHVGILIKNGGHLTINSTTITCSGDWSIGVQVSENCTLISNNSSIFAWSTIFTTGHSTVTITGGSFESKNGSFFITNGS